MFIIFLKSTKEIISYGIGNPTVVGNTLVLDGNSICNDLSVCGWKYIADRRLETDEDGAYLRDADYYEEITPAPSLQDQIDAIVELM